MREYKVHARLLEKRLALGKVTDYSLSNMITDYATMSLRSSCTGSKYTRSRNRSMILELVAVIKRFLDRQDQHILRRVSISTNSKSSQRITKVAGFITSEWRK